MPYPVGRRGGRGPPDHLDFACGQLRHHHRGGLGFADHLRPCCELAEPAWLSLMLGFDTLAGSGSSLLRRNVT